VEIPTTIDGTKLKAEIVLSESSQEVGNGLIFIPNIFERNSVANCNPNYKDC